MRLFQRRQSTQTSIMLKNVGLDTTGKFRCEISGEAPLFQTAYKDAVMAVVGKSMTWKSITQMMLLYILIEYDRFHFIFHYLFL